MKNKGRTIFIWDIHGCYDEFMLLIKKIGVKKNDKVYCVWDIINKWPKSFKVLNFFHKNKEQYKCVMWNHEIGFLRWINGEAPQYNCKQYRVLREKIETKKPELTSFWKNLPLYIEDDDFIVLHWGIIPEKSLESHSIDEIVNLREYEWKPWYNYYTWSKKIIYWHWAMNGVQIREKTIWLDSGCVYGWFLSAYILETNELIWQKALETYINIQNTKKHTSLSKKIINFIKWKFKKLKNTPTIK